MFEPARTADGREIYFHRNSVIDLNFDRLEPGMEIRFSEAPGDQGPQASSVHVIGKHLSQGEKLGRDHGRQ
jgi:cold shock CspA family protein